MTRHEMKHAYEVALWTMWNANRRMRTLPRWAAIDRKAVRQARHQAARLLLATMAGRTREALKANLAGFADVYG